MAGDETSAALQADAELLWLEDSPVDACAPDDGRPALPAWRRGLRG
jgi:hypothetical protein